MVGVRVFVGGESSGGNEDTMKKWGCRDEEDMDVGLWGVWMRWRASSDLCGEGGAQL